MVRNLIIEQLKNSAEVKLALVEREADNILQACRMIVKCFDAGGKLLLTGNGGSASDAEHIAAEFVGKFKIKNRKALPALALSSNLPIITAVVNDFKDDSEFARQVDAFVNNPNDILLVITTSGNSNNILKAIEAAKRKNILTIGFLGSGGGKVKDMLDLSIVVPSNDVARIQESHITVGHIICDIVEQRLFWLEEHKKDNAM